MKILMIVSDMERFRSHRLPLARAILARGWTLSLAAAGARDDAALCAMGIEGLELPAHHGTFGHIQSILAIRRAIRKSGADIIQAVTLRYAFYTGAALFTVRRKTLCVFTIAGLGSLFSTPTLFLRVLRPFLIMAMRALFNRDDVRLIFQNDENRQTFLNLGIVQKERVYLVRGSGVDTDEFPFSPESEADIPVILFGGRLLKDKGVREFVEAARIVRGKNIAARFVLAGDFYPRNPHSLDPALVCAWAQAGIVEWHGAQDDMAGALRDCALAVLPSYHEGLPKFLLEAASTGRAIVTTDIAGCRDVVDDGGNGLLVPVRDVSALAGAIEKLLADPERRRAMGAVGRKMVERDFSSERIVAETLSVYDAFLSNYRVPVARLGRSSGSKP